MELAAQCVIRLGQRLFVKHGIPGQTKYRKIVNVWREKLEGLTGRAEHLGCMLVLTAPAAHHCWHSEWWARPRRSYRSRTHV